MNRPRYVLSIGLALSLPAICFAQTVHTVNAAGGAAFLQPQDAVDSAADGDVILITPLASAFDTYEGLTIAGKGLTIMGDGGRPRIDHSVVSALASGSTIVLRSLEFVGQQLPIVFGSPSNNNGLTISVCSGPVVLEDLHVIGAASVDDPFFGDGKEGLFVFSSPAVSLNRCELRGGLGLNSGLPGFSAWVGGDAMIINGSQVAAWDCSFQGGDGGDGVVFLALPAGGGLGVDVDDSTLLLSGCELAGGDNGSDSGGVCCTARAALFASGASTNVLHLDSTFTAGQGATPVPAIVQLPSGIVQELFGTARIFSIDSPVREGTPVGITYAGAPGDAVFALRSFALSWTLLPFLQGVFHLTPPLGGIVFIGVADATGTATLTVTTPQLPPGFEAATLFSQPFVQGADGLDRLGSPTAILIVDSAL